MTSRAFDEEVDAAKVRRRLQLSQTAFARRYGLSLPTLRNWERGSRLPDAAARAYLTVISRDTDRVASVFAGAKGEGLMRLSLRELEKALDAADAAEVTTARRSPPRSRARAASPPPSPAAPAASRNPAR